jgi:hypothetical protein
VAWTKRIATKDGEPRYKVYWYDPSGAQRSKTFAKSEDARRFERTIEVRKDEGSYVDPSLGKITVEQLAERFMTTAGARLRPASRTLYAAQLRAYILPKLGSRRLSSLGKAEVRTFESELIAEGKGMPTVAAVHRLLHRLFAFAMEEDGSGATLRICGGKSVPSPSHVRPGSWTRRRSIRSRLRSPSGIGLSSGR